MKRIPGLYRSRLAVLNFMFRTWVFLRVHLWRELSLDSNPTSCLAFYSTGSHSNLPLALEQRPGSHSRAVVGRGHRPRLPDLSCGTQNQRSPAAVAVAGRAEAAAGAGWGGGRRRAARSSAR
jgi:hypothetical protein